MQSPAQELAYACMPFWLRFDERAPFRGFQAYPDVVAILFPHRMLLSRSLSCTVSSILRFISGDFRGIPIMSLKLDARGLDARRIWNPLFRIAPTSPHSYCSISLEAEVALKKRSLIHQELLRDKLSYSVPRNVAFRPVQIL